MSIMETVNPFQALIDWAQAIPETVEEKRVREKKHWGGPALVTDTVITDTAESWNKLACELGLTDKSKHLDIALRLMTGAGKLRKQLTIGDALDIVADVHNAAALIKAHAELLVAETIPTRDDAASFPGEEGLKTHAANLANDQREAFAFTRNRLREACFNFSKTSDADLRAAVDARFLQTRRNLLAAARRLAA